MASRNDDNKILRCSFCNKSQEQVRKLIAGPNVYICDECIAICTDIINEVSDGNSEEEVITDNIEDTISYTYKCNKAVANRI